MHSLDAWLLLRRDSHAERRAIGLLVGGVVNALHFLVWLGIIPARHVKPDGGIERLGAFVLPFPRDLAATWVGIALVAPPVEDILAIDDGNCYRSVIVPRHGVLADDGVVVGAISRGVQDMELGEFLIDFDPLNLVGLVLHLLAAQLNEALADLELH